MEILRKVFLLYTLLLVLFIDGLLIYKLYVKLTTPALNITHLKRIPDKVVQRMIYGDEYILMDPAYTVYPYNVTVAALNKACNLLYEEMQKHHIHYKADYFDCDDMAEFIFGHLKVLLVNPACFMYVVMYKTYGHALIVCIVRYHKKLRVIYYDDDCTVSFNITKPIYAYVIG